MGFLGASGAITKDGAGEAAGGGWKSSRGGTRAPSALRRTLRCFVALPPQCCSVLERAGNLLRGEGASQCRICRTEHKPSSAPARPQGNAAPGDGSTGDRASSAPLLGLHTDLLLRVPARLPASTGIATNPVSPTLRGVSLPSLAGTCGHPDHLPIRAQAAPKPAAGAEDHPAARQRAAASLLRGGEEQKWVAAVRGRARLH